MKLSLKLFLFPLALMPFLWDYYIFGIKIFDIVSLVVVIFCIIFLTPAQIRNSTNLSIFMFLSFFLFFGIIGFINFGDPKGFLGLIIGIIYFYFVNIYFNRNDIERISFYILSIFITTFLLQYASTIIFGQPINYHAIIGETPRLQMGLGYRTSGLFMEPTSYCAMMFMIIFTRFLLNSYTKYEFIGIATILLSFSLYGLFVSIALISYLAISKLKEFLLVFLIFIFSLLFFLYFYSGQILVNYDIQFFFIDRLTSLFTDASVQVRYKPQNFDNQSLLQTFFGNGLSTQGILYGSSGFGYLLSGVGMIGFMIFIILLINMYRRNTFFILSSMFVILMSSAYWTMIVFWMWMAWLNILNKNKENLNEIHPQGI